MRGLFVPKQGYLLILNNGTYSLKRARIHEEENLAFWGFNNRNTEVLTNYSTDTYKGKPFYHQLPERGHDAELDAKLDLIAQKQLWKYIGKRSLNARDYLIIMGSGYGIFTIIEQLWGAMFVNA